MEEAGPWGCILSAMLSAASPFSSFCFLAARSKLSHPVSQCSDLPQCGRECQSAWAEASETVGQDQSFPYFAGSFWQSVKTLTSRDSTAVFKMKGRIQQENDTNFSFIAKFS